jgi:hypothetical protein
VKKLPNAPLSPLEARFVRAYLDNGGLAGQAGREVRPKADPSTAEQWGRKRLKDPRIKAALAAVAEEILGDAAVVLKKRLLDTFTQRAFFDIKDILDEHGMFIRPLSELGPLRACIDQIERKETKDGVYAVVKLSDRNAALDRLQKLVGLAEGEGSGEPPNPVQIVVLPVSMTPEQWTSQFSGTRQVDPE